MSETPTRASPSPWVIWCLRLMWIFSAVLIKLGMLAGEAGLLRGAGWMLVIPGISIACGFAAYRQMKIDTPEGAIWATMNLIACFFAAFATMILTTVIVAFSNWHQT